MSDSGSEVDEDDYVTVTDTLSKEDLTAIVAQLIQVKFCAILGLVSSASTCHHIKMASTSLYCNITIAELFLILQLFFFQFIRIQQSVSLNGSLSDNSAIQPGDNVTLKCITLGSSILAWTGTNYVDSRIEFVIIDQIGTMHTPNTYTTATLVNVSTDRNGRYIIESHLNITVQSSIPSSTITCHSVGTAETSAFSFQSSNIPLLTCGGRVVCPGQFRNFSCEIRDSTILAWENDEYIGPHGNRLEFLSTEPVGTVKVSEVNPGVFANLTENYVQNGIRILKCELNISEVSYDSDSISMVCVNVGLDTEGSYSVIVNDDCDSTTTISDESPTKLNTVTNIGTVRSTNDPGGVMTYGVMTDGVRTGGVRTGGVMTVPPTIIIVMVTVAILQVL